jgi:hypothetical protein
VLDRALHRMATLTGNDAVQVTARHILEGVDIDMAFPENHGGVRTSERPPVPDPELVSDPEPELAPEPEPDDPPRKKPIFV